MSNKKGEIVFWRAAIWTGSFFLFLIGSVMAAVDNHTPTTGQTATADASPPNPDTIGIQAVAGSVNVTVNVLPGAQISVVNNGILVRNQSQVTNQGAITISGDTFDGIDFDSNNTIVNGGTITTSGVQSEGLFSMGNNNSVLNSATGTITTAGENSTAILVFGGGSGDTLTNRGTIMTSGIGSNGLGADGNGNQLINDGVITTSGVAAHGIFANGSNNNVVNTGTINVSGQDAHGITSLGTGLGSVTNSGAITASGPGGLGAFLGGPASFTNTATGSITSHQASGIIANGGGTIDNAGSIIGQATGITTANGATNITNSGTITGLSAPGLVFVGNFSNRLANSGTIAGNGPLVNGVATAVQFGSGNATLIMQAGLINGGVIMENFANAVTLSTGSVINGFLNMGTSTAATLTLDGSGTQLYSSAVTNTTIFNGALIKKGTGTWTLDESLTYSGGTTITTGTLQLGNGGTSGSILGNVVDNGTLAFKRSDTVTFPGLISGTGSVTQAGSGTTILTGDNTYSDGTIITAGTLQLGNGGTSGSILGNVVDNGTLVFDRSGAKKIFAGVISGSGSLTKLGSDTLELTADNTYSGGTTIEDGILVAGVPTAGQATSFALGTGDVFLQTGTLRAPSLDPLVINVGRNYTQGPGGTLALGVAGIIGTDYDHVQVGGNASLNGTLAVSSLNNFHPVAGNALGVLATKGSRSGQFATVNDFLNNNPNLQRVDVYPPNGVTLVYLTAVTPAPTPPAPAPSPTPNPRPPVNVVVPTPLPPVEPGAPLPASFLFAALDPTAEQLTSMFEIGFSGANTQRFKLDERFDEIRAGETGFISNLPPAPAPVTATATGKSVVEKQPVLQPTPENRWGAWANGWGDWDSVSNDGSAKGYAFTTGGFIIGLDYRITDHFAVGLMGGYAHTATNLQPSGDIDVNTGRGGLYTTYFDHGFYINAAAYGGHNSYSTSRQALLGMANGSASSGEFSTWTEGGYNFHFSDFTVCPVGALQYTFVHVDGFSEQGSLLPLQIHSNQEASLRTDLGARIIYTWHLGKVLLIPTLTVAWEHEYLYSALPLTVSSAEFPGSGKFSGPSEGHDSVIVNTGAAIQWTRRISTYLGYQGQLARNHYNSNAITGGVSFTF
ncbi:MAG TPA: autotransporter domain-containing protein [Candidatus Binatia bacterium]|nr:autotransporter domain-containing protein [Candidatus Binatia bacterium]